MRTGRYQAADSLCKVIGGKTGIRITLILHSGEVVADSREHPNLMENHSSRPEVVQAIAGAEGMALRFSSTVNETMMYIAIPSGGFVVRTSIPVTSIDQALGSTNLRILLGGLVIVVMAGLISVYVSRRISRPLEHLKLGAERFARGVFDRKLSVSGSEEIRALAEAMNVMADQISQKLAALDESRQSQEAIMSSMIEGVVAVDSEERIASVNRAAARLFDITIDVVAGRYLHEVIRNSTLQRLVRETLRSGQPAQVELSTGGGQPLFLQASASIMRDAQSHGIGVVLVLNDVTRIQKLE
ncbi:MAG: PAS domain-containing protein, partial [Chitinivibrionia bacterium]|nr:PAS domain-containing protein [Chitinivibrionia bacterium]